MFLILVVGSYIFMRGIVYSENIYGLIGSVRGVIIMLSFEVILMLIVVKSSVLVLMILLLVFACEVGRTPYDLVEGESELVSRFNTEFAGGVFTLFFLREYAFLVSLIVIYLNLTLGVMIYICLAMLMRGSWPRSKFPEVMCMMWR